MITMKPPLEMAKRSNPRVYDDNTSDTTPIKAGNGRRLDLRETSDDGVEGYVSVSCKTVTAPSPRRSLTEGDNNDAPIEAAVRRGDLHKTSNDVVEEYDSVSSKTVTAPSPGRRLKEETTIACTLRQMKIKRKNLHMIDRSYVTIY